MLLFFVLTALLYQHESFLLVPINYEKKFPSDPDYVYVGDNPPNFQLNNIGLPNTDFKNIGLPNMPSFSWTMFPNWSWFQSSSVGQDKSIQEQRRQQADAAAKAKRDADAAAKAKKAAEAAAEALKAKQAQEAANANANVQSTDTQTQPAPSSSQTTRLSNKDIDSILTTHNKYRATHQAPPLKWDESIAEDSYKYAMTCPQGHSHAPNRGENLAWGYTTFDSAIKAWYDEEVLYNYDERNFSAQTGHFTQVVWKDTSLVGCGINPDCVHTASQSKQAIVCQYSPPGNVVSSGDKLVDGQVMKKVVLGAGA